MSEITELKAHLAAIAREVKDATQGLEAGKTRINKTVVMANETVSGTAKNVHSAIISSLTMAQRKIDESVRALQAAASEATKYAAGL